MDDKAVKKFLVKDDASKLQGLHDVLAAADDWTAPVLETRVQRWLAETGLQLEDIGQPVRVALTGRTASPSLFEVLALLGRDRSVARLESAVRVAQLA
jgi:glutamyl-tRNA synthetase